MKSAHVTDVSRERVNLAALGIPGPYGPKPTVRRGRRFASGRGR